MASMARFTDEELYVKYSDRLIRFASTIVGPADAEDVMIDGVIGAFGSRGWNSVDDRPSYLYQSCRGPNIRSWALIRGNAADAGQLCSAFSTASSPCSALSPPRSPAHDEQDG